MTFMSYQRQENGDSPEDEVVGIEEHELSQFAVKSCVYTLFETK